MAAALHTGPVRAARMVANTGSRQHLHSCSGIASARRWHGQAFPHGSSTSSILYTGNWSGQRRCNRHQQRVLAVDHAEPPSIAVGDLTPYILWDTHLMVSAAWHVQLDEADLGPIRTELLKLGGLDITFMRGARRQGALRDDGPVMALSATCPPNCKEALVAGILKVTPAAEVRLFPCERAYLPTKALEVNTPYGTVNVDVELAGSTVVGVRADAECCEQLAKRSSGPSGPGSATDSVTAQDVADSARAAVKEGLEQGNISLGLEFLY